MPKPKDITPRAKRVWQRLIEWYGARIVEQYGESPPDDWRDVIDAADNDTVKRGLGLIRTRYVQHPPTLPQFDQAMQPQVVAKGPTAGVRLVAFAVREYGRRMTPRQISQPWTHIGGAGGTDSTGLVIPADGDSPGYRIMLADIDAPTFAQASLE